MDGPFLWLFCPKLPERFCLKETEALLDCFVSADRLLAVVSSFVLTGLAVLVSSFVLTGLAVLVSSFVLTGLAVLVSSFVLTGLAVLVSSFVLTGLAVLVSSFVLTGLAVLVSFVSTDRLCERFVLKEPTTSVNVSF